MQWEWVDLAILGVVGLSVLTGVFRGVVKELVSLSVWILAVWLAYSQSGHVNPLLRNYLHDETARALASFLIVLVGTLVVGGIAGAMVGFVIRKTGLGPTDRLLGMGFGFLRGIFIVALLVLVVKMTAIPVEDITRKSLLYARFDPLVHWMEGMVPSVMKQVKGLDQQHLLAGIVSADGYTQEPEPAASLPPKAPESGSI